MGTPCPCSGPPRAHSRRSCWISGADENHSHIGSDIMGLRIYDLHGFLYPGTWISSIPLYTCENWGSDGLSSLPKKTTQVVSKETRICSWVCLHSFVRFLFHPTDSVVLNMSMCVCLGEREILLPQEMFGHVWRNFLLSHPGGGYWHLMGRSYRTASYKKELSGPKCQ